MSNLTVLPKIQQACRNNANGIKPGSNSKMTDKHAAEHSKNACLGLNKYVCNIAIFVCTGKVPYKLELFI